MSDLIKKSFKSCPIIMKGKYPYIIHPITDGIPRMDPKVIEILVDEIVDVADLDCDLIITPEALGIPLAVPVSMKTWIPFTIIRKRCYGLPGEITIDEVTGYSSTKMYINDVHAGERIVLIDDLISTGGTLRAIVNALRGAGCVITDVIIAVSKCEDISALEKELGINIKTLYDVRVIDGKVMCD